MPNVTFHGGPCANRTHSYTVASLADGLVTCGDVVYGVFPNGRGGYFGVPESRINPTAAVPPLSGAARSWRQLVRGVAKTAPNYLVESAHYRRAMLRLARR